MPDFDWSRYQAVLFDLDGVLTSTAALHARAWKRTFDEVLPRLVGPGAAPFDIDADYRAHVDGRPRYEGVAEFLGSRGIRMPWGDPSDPPGTDTICAIGNLKNERVSEVLAGGAVEPFAGSVALLDHLASLGVRTAVVSSSANAGRVLEAAGIADRFDARVDGLVAAAEEIPGKPSPDTFLEAARRLGVEPAKAVVIEDAVAGVEAGAAGEFGAVIGVDRHGEAESLKAAGADVVVSDLGELVP